MVMDPHRRPHGKGPSGFTLIELLVVTAIIGILASMLLPSLTSAKKLGHKRYCMNNLRQLGMGAMLYADKFGRGFNYPPDTGGKFLLDLVSLGGPAAILYESEGLLFCPLAGSSVVSGKTDYRGPKTQVSMRFRPNDVIASDKETNHSPTGNEDMNVLFFDGRVELVPYEDVIWNRANLWTIE